MAYFATAVSDYNYIIIYLGWWGQTLTESGLVNGKKISLEYEK